MTACGEFTFLPKLCSYALAGQVLATAVAMATVVRFFAAYAAQDDNVVREGKGPSQLALLRMTTW